MLTAIPTTIAQLTTDGKAPIRTIEIPEEAKEKLRILKENGLEAYIVGGYIRNRLLGFPVNPDEDFDIMVNAEPEQFPNKAFSKRGQQGCHHNDNLTRLWHLGNVDFWCEPWTNIEDDFQKRDLTINTFICDADGNVYDLLCAEKDLDSPYLHMIGNPAERFKAEPHLILRVLRFANQLNKQIHPTDVIAIQENSSQIGSLELGRYLKNLQQLFMSRFSLQNLELIKSLKLFNILFPTVVVEPKLAMKTYNVCSQEYMAELINCFEPEHNVYQFIKKNLEKWTVEPPKKEKGTHVLALFTIVIMYLHRNDLVFLKEGSNNFINKMLNAHPTDEGNKLYQFRVLKKLIFGVNGSKGLFAEFNDFADMPLRIEQPKKVKRYKPAKKATTLTNPAQKSYTPQFRAIAKHPPKAGQGIAFSAFLPEVSKTKPNYSS